MTDRESIKACAEQIMRLTPRHLTDGSLMYTFPRAREGSGCSNYLILHPEESKYIRKLEGWNPLESDADCFMLLDKLIEMKRGPVSMSFDGGEWFVEIEYLSARNVERRRAIVMAALTTVEDVAEVEG